MAIITNADGSNPLVGTPEADQLDSTFVAALTTLIGGAGNDTYHIGSDDLVVEEAGGGGDTVRVAGTYALAPFVENLALLGVNNYDGTGNALANRITGNAADNVLSGGAGNDELLGLAGADTLYGGTGIDRMTGGTGNDTYFVDNMADVVIEANGASQGNADHVIVETHFFQLPDNVENITLTGSYRSTAYGNGLANRLQGSDGDNLLRGYGGNDVIDGGRGADNMQGGTGDDTYYVEDAGDRVMELADGGFDTVYLSVTQDFSLSYYVENFTLLDPDSGELVNLVANNRVNVILGNNNPNIIDARGGNDTVEGRGGDDTLLGGAGVDRLLGGEGDDYLDGGTGADRMIGGIGDDTYVFDDPGDAATEVAGEGYDTLYVQFVPATGTYLLPATLEALSFARMPGVAINGNGNALDNLIEGNDAANRLNGGTGNDYLIGGGGGDTLVGGAGNDWYFIGSRGATDFTPDSTLVELAGQGNDSVRTTVDLDLSDPALGGANVENVYLDDPGFGQGSYDYVEPDWDLHVVGNALDNRIYGNLGDNTVEGGAGNDSFYFYGYELDLRPFDPFGNAVAFFGPTLDAGDIVHGGTSVADEGDHDALFASIMDYTGALHVHGVEDITLYSGTDNEGASNTIDTTDITGAERVTIAHIRVEDFKAGVPFDQATASMTLTGLTGDFGIRTEGFIGADLTLAGANPGTELDVTMNGFGPGRTGGGLSLQNVETLNLDFAAGPNQFDQVAVRSSDLEHLVASGANTEAFLDLRSTDADLTLRDTSALDLVLILLPGALDVVLDSADGALVTGDALTTLHLDTSGETGASNIFLVSAISTAVTVTGGQDLTLGFSPPDDAGEKVLDASSMTGNLKAGNADYLNASDMTGGLGNDQLIGGMGGDRLNAGGAGSDLLTGNEGADTFVFDEGSGFGNPDHDVTVTDFASGVDGFELAGAVFAGVDTGILAADEFFLGNASGIAGEHFAFDGTTGGLYYDADGVAGGAQRVATVQTGASVAHSDITIV